MRKDYTVKTHRISLAAMFAAMTLIVLYLAAILPSGRLSLYFLSSIFIAGLLVEDEPCLLYTSRGNVFQTYNLCGFFFPDDEGAGIDR